MYLIITKNWSINNRAMWRRDSMEQRHVCYSRPWAFPASHFLVTRNRYHTIASCIWCKFFNSSVAPFPRFFLSLFSFFPCSFLYSFQSAFIGFFISCFLHTFVFYIDFLFLFLLSLLSAYYICIVAVYVTNLAWSQLAARRWIINIFLEIRNPDLWRI